MYIYAVRWTVIFVMARYFGLDFNHHSGDSDWRWHSEMAGGRVHMIHIYSMSICMTFGVIWMMVIIWERLGLSCGQDIGYRIVHLVYVLIG